MIGCENASNDLEFIVKMIVFIIIFNENNKTELEIEDSCQIKHKLAASLPNFDVFCPKNTLWNLLFTFCVTR